MQRFRRTSTLPGTTWPAAAGLRLVPVLALSAAAATGATAALAAPEPVRDALLAACALLAAVGLAAARHYRSQLDSRTARLSALVEGVDAILWEGSPKTLRICFVSHSVERILGYPRDRWLSEEGFWERHIHPDDRERVVTDARRYVEAGQSYVLQYRVLAADGTIVWLRDIVSVHAGEDGRPERITGVAIDVTERKEFERSLNESRSRLNAILDAALDCIVTIDAGGRIVDFNPAAERTFGYPREQAVGRVMSELVVPERLRAAHDAAFARYLETGESRILGRRLELSAIRADGSEFPVELAIARVDVPGPPLLTAYLRDITERRIAEERQRMIEEALKHQALHDALTGLPNRTLFHDRATQAIKLAERQRSELAVAIIDLDRFKEINDTLGHQTGDRVLDEIGKRLAASLRASDTVARLGGDEFGLLFPCASLAEAMEIVERVQQEVAQPLTVAGVPLQIEASIGLALSPEHGRDVDVLLQRADIAMYVAKSARSAIAVYDRTNDTYDAGRLALGVELRQAVERRELVVHYQPQVDVRSGATVGVEALVRWQHPRRGLLLPAEFIPFAEHTGLMRAVTLYVLDDALRICGTLPSGGRAPSVSVNVSMRDLIDTRFPVEVRQLLGTHGVEPGLLTLEITESAILDDPFRARAILEDLGRIGVRISVDDFGTGYSSLARLRRLPIHELKIDRSFVSTMCASTDDAVIVRSTVDLAHNLGLSVVAEGVETPETLALLAEVGCDTAQGFHVSKPLTADALRAWLARGADEVAAYAASA